MERETAVSLFNVAGIATERLWELPNMYWPDVDAYAEVRRNHPWWLVKTPHGLIQIGWRKRVISIDWSDTPARGIVTDDDVTKTDSSVHAWSATKAAEYLAALRKLLAT